MNMTGQKLRQLLTVPPYSSLDWQKRRFHIIRRHYPGFGFWDIRHHNDDHRLRGDQLDHTHSRNGSDG